LAKTKLQKLFDKAWRLQSQYIKLRDSDWRGYGNCCTCNEIVEAFTKKGHAGHYRHGFLDFNEKNINLQCSGCNRYRNGALDQYTIFLINKYGTKVIKELDTAFHAHKLKTDQTGKKYTEEELNDIIENLKTKIAKLKK